LNRRKTATAKKNFIVCLICFTPGHPLAVGHLFKSRWITVSDDGELRGGDVEFAEIIGREFDNNRSNVLFKTLELGGAGNGNDPQFLGQVPGECDLCRCRILLRGE